MILAGLGRLGGDVALRYLPDGTTVADLSLAYNHGKKDDAGKRPTQWVKATMWGDRAEKLAPHLLKGTLLSVVLDDVHVETYDRKDGGTGTTLKGRVSSLEFAGGKREDRPAGESRPAAMDSRGDTDRLPAGKPQPGGFDQMDDDIPF